MKQHKWAKEIKAWADGAEIQCRRYCIDEEWHDTNPAWDDLYEYRIKPQPKKPQYLYVWKPYDEENEVVLDIREPEGILDDGVYRYFGKIKLETEND